MLQFLHTHWRDIGAILIALYLLWLIIYRPEDLFLAGRSRRPR